MAHVTIRLRTGNGDYEIEVERPETNGQAFGGDIAHLDALIDKAVTRMKRAYTPTPNEAEEYQLSAHPPMGADEFTQRWNARNEGDAK